VRLFAIGVMFAAGCVASPEATITTSIREDQGMLVRQTGLYVSFVKRTMTLEVNAGVAGPLLATGSAKPSATIAVQIEHHPCELFVDRVFQDSESSPASPKSRELKTRTFLEAQVTLRCADGPVPGNPANDPGVRGFALLLWAVPFLLLGLALGAGWDDTAGSTLTRRQTVVMLLGLAGMIAAITLAVLLLDGLFVATSALLFVGYGLIGAGGTMRWRKRDRIGGSALVLGAAGAGSAIALAIPMWAWAAPVLALGIGGVVGLILLVLADTAFKK
jgi:hypothetical protein